MWLVGGLALALGLPGCGGDDAASGPPDSWMELGEGADAFREVTPDEVVAIGTGEQGGYHVSLALRVRATAERAVASYGARDAQTEQELSWPNLKRNVEINPDEDLNEVTGITCFLQGTDPSVYNGRRVILWADLSIDEGLTAKDEVEATIVYDGP
jgi:hypothetical protein